MMKKVIAILLTVILTAALMCACETGGLPEGTVSTSSSSPASSQGGGSTSSSAPDVTPTTVASAGSISDYVMTAKEAVVSNNGENERTLRLPKFLMNTADANAANSEIMSRFGDDCVPTSEFSPVIMMDYEATLNDGVLSLYVTAKYEGGNVYGLCYCFDAASGNKLDNQTLCSTTGRDYDTAIATLTANLTTEYDNTYSALQGNESYREKTLSADNVAASVMYLDSVGKLTAMVTTYAAVGGGQWVMFVAAE